MDYKSKLALSYEEFSALVGEERDPVDKIYRVLEDKHSSNDMGKGIEERKMIVERIEDGKFFKFEYSRSDHHNLNEGGLNDFPKSGYEVFRKVITEIVYT